MLGTNIFQFERFDEPGARASVEFGDPSIPPVSIPPKRVVLKQPISIPQPTSTLDIMMLMEKYNYCAFSIYVTAGDSEISVQGLDF